MAFDPCRYPLLDRWAILLRAVAQIFFPLTEVTSLGEKEESREAVSVASRDGDLSELPAAVTSAWQRAVLEKK